MSGRRGGKFSKPTRGGGKKFSKGLRPLEDDRPGMWDADTPEIESGSGEEEEESDGAATLTREERRAAEKARKEAARAKKLEEKSESEDEEEEDVKGNPSLAPGNPNSSGNPSTGMSRREREAKDAAAAKERYKKLHAQGKTDEAKADLARLAVIRKEREEKAKQRQAELEEKRLATEAKKAGRN